VRIFTIFPIHRGVRWDHGGRWCRLVAWLSAGRRQPKGPGPPPACGEVRRHCVDATALRQAGGPPGCPGPRRGLWTGHPRRYGATGQGQRAGLPHPHGPRFSAVSPAAGPGAAAGGSPRWRSDCGGQILHGEVFDGGGAVVVHGLA
jgi:hypothetical protein